MRSIARFLLFFLLSFSYYNLQAQVKEQEEIYNIYKEQVRALLEERGLKPAEIQKLIEFYKGQNNLTDQNIASLLQRIYPQKKGIAVIFYVFNNDSLHRIFFEPGKLISHDIIPITRDQLLQVNTNMNHALRIYDLTSARSPRSE